MSDETNNVLVERADSTETEQNDNKVIESNTEKLDNVEKVELAEPKTPETPTKSYKERQVEAWVKKIEAGESDLTDIDNNPALHWMKAEVEQGLGLHKEIKVDVAAEMEKIETAKSHKTNLELLEDYSTEDYNKIVREVNERVQDGAKQELSLARVLQKYANDDKGEKRNKMRMPTGIPAVNRAKKVDERENFYMNNVPEALK